MRASIEENGGEKKARKKKKKAGVWFRDRKREGKKTITLNQKRPDVHLHHS